MSLSQRYNPAAEEPRLEAYWQESGTYYFERDANTPVYAIDTPPPTVSGNLHLGSVYSYTHTDLLARFWRMNGRNVYYPMGFDDNGLPTERLVEKRLGLTAEQVGREAFIQKCLEVSEEAEREYRALWERLALSIDWRYTYRSIDDNARRISQWSFLDLYRKGLAYQQEAPAIWCPECQTALAQAELNDLDRETTFYTLAFHFADGSILPIATTRPELLPACVAVFVHPDDGRYKAHIGERVTTPLGDEVPLLADEKADPTKGTGAVMCCTFGDQTDIDWWREYHLPLRIILGKDGRLNELAGKYAGMTANEARDAIVGDLEARGLVLGRETVMQSVRVHERDDTPVEYIVTRQWFVRALDFKEQLIAAGERIAWHPEHMGTRYRIWVENLKWDWNIARQRYFGVPFPVWYCDSCGETLLADEAQLPVDPLTAQPPHSCTCGGTSFTPETDVMDTWATSSMSPQIAGRYFAEPELYAKVFPFSLRPQAHEIIRTWAFYTILKSLHHFDALPWTAVAISGWGLAPQGTAKLSKSRGGGPMAPMAMIEKYSSDAVRYWAASTGLGKDSVISEEKIQAGGKLVTKLWNVARFCERFLAGYMPSTSPPAELTPADCWLLSRLQRLIQETSAQFEAYDYASAKSVVEAFFWRDLADNYLEMAKSRLYDEESSEREGARYALHATLLTVVKLFAPFLPHVTEAIYLGLFAQGEAHVSVHRSAWPQTNPALLDEQAETAGEALVAIATSVRRYKSASNLSLGAELPGLILVTENTTLAERLDASQADIRSITRARTVSVASKAPEDAQPLAIEGQVAVYLASDEG
jgi:valyl-tRNA synthetase